MAEIFNGKGDYFPGLLPLTYAYLEFIHTDKKSFVKIDAYLKFVQARATGELQTAAAWMRTFVTQHPEYQHDSVVTSAIAHDLLAACDGIGRGDLKPEALLGDADILPVRADEAYGAPLLRSRIRSSCRRVLLDRYKARVNGRDARLKVSRRRSPSNAAAEAGLIDLR